MRILLMESIPLLEEALVNKLQCSGHIVTAHSPVNMEAFETVMVQSIYDLLWIDTCIFSGGSGRKLKIVRKIVPATKVLLFGSNETIPEIKNYYMNGGHGYLTKNSEFSEINMALYLIEKGGIYISFSLQQELTQWFSNSAVQKKSNLTITIREKEILKLIVEENTTKEIAQKLHICPSTVETHRLKLIQKLDVKNTAGLVRVAFESGFYTFKNSQWIS